MSLEIEIDIEEDLIDLACNYLDKKKLEFDLINNWILEKNVVQLKAWAHKVKGTSASYGISPLNQYAAEIEKLLQDSNWSQIKDETVRIESVLRTIKLKPVKVE